MRSWSNIITKHLSELAPEYPDGKLAFLALTQKVEHTIRDSLAFSIHREIGASYGAVCREWNRFDLAYINHKREPEMLLEAKAIYTFDIIKKGARHNYPALLNSDVAKLQKYKNNTKSLFTLLLATHPHSAPRQLYSEAIKYYGSVKKYAPPNFTISDADQEVRRRLNHLPHIASGAINGGTAFETEVSIAYWLFGPF